MNSHASLRNWINSNRLALLTHFRIRVFGKRRSNEFELFIKPYFDSVNYLTRNPDVASANIDPWLHWISFGIYEGRMISPLLRVQLQTPAKQISSGQWKEFNWNGQTVHILIKTDIGISDNIRRQFLNQSKLDPSILAPGLLALDDLRKIAFSGKDYLVQMQQKESARTEIPSLKISYPFTLTLSLEGDHVRLISVPEMEDTLNPFGIEGDELSVIVVEDILLLILE